MNASSFDPQRSVYYALINNFPGKANSTLDQQIVTADFSREGAAGGAVTRVPVASDSVMLQFIAYSAKTGGVYFAGPAKSIPNMVYVGQLCPKTGAIKQVMYSAGGVVSVGPLTVNDDSQELLVYVKLASAVNQWKLLSLNYLTLQMTEVKYYEGDSYRSFAAAVHV